MRVSFPFLCVDIDPADAHVIYAVVACVDVNAHAVVANVVAEAAW